MAMDKVASSPALSVTEGWPDEESALSENEVAALNVALGVGMSVSASTAEEAAERHTVADLTSIGPATSGGGGGGGGRVVALPPTADLAASVARLQPVLEASEAVEEEADHKVASFYIGGDEDKLCSPRASVRRQGGEEGQGRGRSRAIHFTPPDGGYGWVVALSACFINLWIVGFVKSYGVLYLEVRRSFPEASAYHASWLPSLLSTVGLLIAPVTGTLCRRFTSRKVSFVGGFLCFLGLLLGSQAATMNQLILSTGLLTGLGAGLTTTPGVLIVSLYFDKRRTFASALCVSGNALGGFFLPPLVDHLLATYGLRGTLMILAAMQLHICALSMLYRPISHHALVQARQQQQQQQQHYQTDNQVPVLKEKLLSGTPASQRLQAADDLQGSAPHTPMARSKAIWHKILRRRLNSTTSAEDAELQRQVSFLRSSSMMNSIPDLTRYARSWSVGGERSPGAGSRSPGPTSFPLDGSKSTLSSSSRLSLSKLPLFAEHPSVLRLSSEEEGSRVASVRLLRASSRRRLSQQQSRVSPAAAAATENRPQPMRQVSVRTVHTRIMTSVLETDAAAAADSRAADDEDARPTQLDKAGGGADAAREVRDADEAEAKKDCCLPGLCDCSLFREPLFLMMALSVFLMSCGAPFSLFFLPAYAETTGIASSSVPTMLSISSIVDLAGRLGMGFISDLGCCHMTHIYVLSGLAAASAVLTMPHMRSFSGLTASLAVYGFGVGSWFVLIPPILAQHHGAAHLASSYGLVRLFNGLMNFISPQLNGVLYDATKDYRVLYLFMGSCMVVASLVVLLTPLLLRLKDANHIKSPA